MSKENKVKIQMYNSHGKWSLKDHDVFDDFTEVEKAKLYARVKKKMKGVPFEIEGVSAVSVEYDPDSIPEKRFNYVLNVEIETEVDEEGNESGYIDDEPRFSGKASLRPA